MHCYCCWKNNQYRKICFASIKLAWSMSYHLRMFNRILLWFGKLPQWNRHANGTLFESGLKFQSWPHWDYQQNNFSKRFSEKSLLKSNKYLTEYFFPEIEKYQRNVVEQSKKQSITPPFACGQFCSPSCAPSCSVGK